MADNETAVAAQNRPVLAETLRHYWYAVARSEQVSDRPVGVRLLDQPLVLWRSQSQLAAFYDLCIHRGTPLSLGWVDQDELVCAYHGWSYGPSGACTRIPSLPPQRGIPAKARATAYRCQERYGLVWVCLDDPVADIPPLPPELDDPSWGWEAGAGEGYWRANAARFIENMMDTSHFPWVHPGILGDRALPEVEDITIEQIEGGFQWYTTVPVNPMVQASAPMERLYQIFLPFTIVFQSRTSGSDARDIISFIGTPVSTKETKYFLVTGRNYRHQLSDEELRARSARIVGADQVIVESQRPEELPLDLSEELHLRGPDAGAVEYRKQLRRLGVDWA
jgi:phenylpropionate dioxygenase-like ring-hydroxylating dioxygenase large terminal subunit